MKIIQPTPSSATLTSSDAPRVAFALSMEEKELFFGTSRTMPSSSFQWLHEVDRLDPDAWAALLRNENPEVLVSCWGTPPLPVDWLNDPACALRYVCHLTGSVRRVVPRSFLVSGFVTNWGDLVGPTVAEHALLLALSALRSQGSWDDYMALPLNGRPKAALYCRTRSLVGCRVGIFGFGSVARALLKLLAPFQVSVSAYSQGVPSSVIKSEGVHECASLEELVAENDVLFICEALTDDTQGCLTAALLRTLPEDAVLVNVARDGLLEKDALLAEGVRGRIRVALDVCSEPMTADLSVREFPGIVISPHIGGPTLDYYSRLGAHALENIDCYLLGQPVRSRVTLEAYDRAT